MDRSSARKMNFAKPSRRSPRDGFISLELMEARLAENGPYLLGDQMTEADLRLFCTPLCRPIPSGSTTIRESRRRSTSTTSNATTTSTPRRLFRSDIRPFQE